MTVPSHAVLPPRPAQAQARPQCAHQLRRVIHHRVFSDLGNGVFRERCERTLGCDELFWRRQGAPAVPALSLQHKPPCATLAHQLMRFLSE